MERINIGLVAHDKATAPIKKVQQQVSQFRVVVDNSTKSTANFNKSMQAGTRSSGMMRGGIQQLGFQAQDVAVQLGAGTNAAQVFAQQGSQILSVFGAGGAVLGAVVAVVGSLGAAYMRSGAFTKSFADEHEELNELLDDAATLGGTAKEQFDRLKDTYGTVTTSVIALNEAQKNLIRLDIAKNFAQLKEAVFDSASEFLNVADRLKTISEGDRDAKRAKQGLATALQLLNKEFELSKPKIKEVSVLLKELLEVPAEKGEEATQIISKIINIFGNANPEKVRELQDTLVKFGLTIPKVSETLNELSEEASDSVDGLAANFMKNFGDVIPTAASSVQSAISDALTGAKSAMDAFKDATSKIVSAIISKFLELAVINPILNSIFGGVSGYEKAPTMSFGQKTAFATGGSVRRGRPIMVGEAGAELFIPNKAGVIVPNNQLSGGDGVTINQTINVTTGVQQTVRTEIASLMPQIAQATKSAVADARMRGGSYSKAFGR
jgi:hypothetical protein